MVGEDRGPFPLISTFLCSFLNASFSECPIPSNVRPHASLISSGVHGCMIKQQQFLISSALPVIWILFRSRLNSSQNRLWGHLKFVQYKSKFSIVHIVRSSSHQISFPRIERSFRSTLSRFFNEFDLLRAISMPKGLG